MKEEFKNADWSVKSPMCTDYEIGESESGKSEQAFIIASENEKEINEMVFQKTPNMWSLNYIGLYSQYAAVGLLYGSSGTLLPFCVYIFNGSANVCSNASHITFFAWSFKLVFAVITDTFRPFGLRRKPWMIFGWFFVLIMLLVLATTAHKMTVSQWLISLLVMQGFLMFSDVPADGYSVELGKIESPLQRGQILATGQRIRFSFGLIAGLIQTFLLNGPSTNESTCIHGFDGCWEWGLSINGYYGLLLILIFFLVIPLLWLKECDPSLVPVHSFKDFFLELWSTLKNLTTLYLLIFAVGTGVLTNFPSIVSIYMQYYIIGLTNFQAGIDTITSYASLVLAVWIFQKYLINRNWRITQYGSTIFSSILGLLWLFPYWNIDGTRNAWFTIFIDLDQSFIQGLSQVLLSMAVIEVAKVGQEATTYELIMTVFNASLTLSSIFATQLLTPLKAVGCTSTDGCPKDQVDITNGAKFDQSNGPYRFTVYSIVLMAISISCCMFFTVFFPRSKKECEEWRIKGKKSQGDALRGCLAVALALAIILVYLYTYM
mmetsp:Transcript_10607/g.10252  ORF Transcript_10607/g.10252 Transcript_10607/m.10252 type:complete len:546 (+) Transcript_10607:171-1808(+)